VWEVNEQGRKIKEFCVHIGSTHPQADNVLAQKLALQYHEAHLLSRANVLTIPILREAA